MMSKWQEFKSGYQQGKEKAQQRGLLDFLDVLGIMFLTMFGLKVAGIGPAANYSWLIITSPFWGLIAAIFAYFILTFLWHLTLGIIKKTNE